MTIHTNLPIYRTGTKLLSLAVRAQEQMPRGVKRTLGEKISGQKVGKNTIPAIDIDFLLEASNEHLTLVHPRLKEALFFNAAAENGQEKLDGVPDVLPNRKFPKLGPLKWEDETEGNDLVIDYGLGEEGGSNVELADCRVKLKHIELKEGSFALSFQAQTANIPDGALDKVKGLLNRSTKVTCVRPDKLREQAVIDGTVGHPGAAQQRAAEEAGQQRLDDAPRVGKEENGPDWPFGTEEPGDEEPSAADIVAAQIAAEQRAPEKAKPKPAAKKPQSRRKGRAA